MNQTYVYFVKCPGCTDEPFDFFDEAKAHAMSCLTQKPVITQMECCYNDNGFGERVSSNDLGIVWSWEDMMQDIPAENELTTFSKAETFGGDDYFNCEFDDLDTVPDNFRKPYITEGISDSTRPLRDSDFVVVSKHPNHNTYSFLGNNYRMTKQLDKAMPYSTKDEAEYDLVYAEEQSDVRGSHYDSYTSNQFFVTTYGEAKTLVKDLSDQVVQRAEKTAARSALTDEVRQLAIDMYNDGTQCDTWEEFEAFMLANDYPQPTKHLYYNTYRAELKKCARAARSNSSRIDEWVDSSGNTIGSNYVLAYDNNDHLIFWRGGPIGPNNDYFADNLTGAKKFTSEAAAAACANEATEQYAAATDFYATFEVMYVDSYGKLHDCGRKPIPEGMTVESLIEEMEENEDTVECKVCEELYEKAKCHKDPELGWVCEGCCPTSKEDLTEDFGEEQSWECYFDGRYVGTVSAVEEDEALEKMQQEYPEYHYGMYDGCFWVEPEYEINESLTESRYRDSVEFHYNSLTTEIVTRVIPATYLDPEDYEEGEYTDEYYFEVDTNTVKEVLWNEFITEEDVVDVPGGLDALEDNTAWEAFLDTHFDELLEKYYDKFLEYFREDAEEAARVDFQERYYDAMYDAE